MQRVHRFRISHPPAPRSFGVALLLTVLMPGLGHVYCGALGRGLRAWALAFGALLVAFLAWLRWLFVPWLPLAVLLLAWAFFVGVLAADLWRLVHGDGPGGRRFVLTPSNHVVVYLSLFVGLWGGPLLLAQHVVRRMRVGVVSVDDRAMFPKLLEGDRVLYDRAAFRKVPPVAGDLVVVRWSTGEPRIARVIGTGGHTISLQGGRPFVDGAPVPWAPIEALRVPALGDGPDAIELAGLRAYAEEPAAPAYVVTYGVMPPRDPPPVVLAPGEYFVMGDNRATALADDGFGRVTAEAILGRPRFVFASQSPDGDLRDGRIGWPVR